MGGKVDEKRIARDIRAGAHKTALMVKYDLTPRQLRELLKKLEESGLIEPADPSEPIHVAEHQEKTLLLCPKCGTPLPQVNGECPKCGLAAGKYGGPDYSSARGARESFRLRSTESFFLSNVVSALVLIAVVGGGYLLYGSYVEHKQYSAAMVEIRPTIVSLSERKKIDWGRASLSLDDSLGRWKGLLSQSYPELTTHLKEVAAEVFKAKLLASELQSLEHQYARLGDGQDEDGSIRAKGIGSDSSNRVGYDPLRSDEEAERRWALTQKIEATQAKLRDIRGTLAFLCDTILEEM